MADIVDAATRSRMMAGIRGENTGPEVAVRRFLHRRGFRFRLHGSGLPGRPDIVLPKHGVVVFVHGCFWHRHPRCRLATTPGSNVDFWKNKFAANVERDRRKATELRRRGWKVVTVWGCQTASEQKLNALAGRILGGRG